MNKQEMIKQMRYNIDRSYQVDARYFCKCIKCLECDKYLPELSSLCDTYDEYGSGVHIDTMISFIKTKYLNPIEKLRELIK